MTSQNDVMMSQNDVMTFFLKKENLFSVYFVFCVMFFNYIHKIEGYLKNSEKSTRHTYTFGVGHFVKMSDC